METTKVAESKEKEGFLGQFHWHHDSSPLPGEVIRAALNEDRPL